MIRQSQSQRLLQKLSPQQIQLMKLLQIPTAALEERVKEELEENPALEMGEEGHDEENNDQELSKDEADAESDAADDYEGDDYEDKDEPAEREKDDLDLSDFMNQTNDDDPGDYRYNSDDYGEERPETPVRLETSFYEHLTGQMGLLNLDEASWVIAEQIIGSIDDDGYLRREPEAIVDDLAFARNIETDLATVEDLIRRIQYSFDPPGVCAWDLRECLILQLERMTPKTDAVVRARVVMEKYFNEFTKKHYERIQRGLGINGEEFKEVVGVIVHLNPKPGAQYASLNKAESYIVPDFFVYNNGGIPELTLNSRNAPELRISEGYREMLRAYERSDKKNRDQRDALTFIKQKLDAAKWFIDAIRQRQNTLLHTMQSIIELQKDFFLSGDDTALKPMILKDVAQRTGLDISTISRVASSKFVQTEFGTYRLKHFFSEGMLTETGEEVSTREVKSILSDFIEDEDKSRPLSDDRLTELLQEKGYNIARRTVAKYREQLNVPVARLRREL